MNRRDLITVFGGIAVAWPVRARSLLQRISLFMAPYVGQALMSCA
jgi:hypothetical protein